MQVYKTDTKWVSEESFTALTIAYSLVIIGKYFIEKHGFNGFKMCTRRIIFFHFAHLFLRSVLIMLMVWLTTYAKLCRYNKIAN